MSVLDRAQAFIDNEEALDREALREWLPELLEIKYELENMYYPTAYGTHARPDVQLCGLLTGVRRLIAKTEMIGVANDADEWIIYAPMEA